MHASLSTATSEDDPKNPNEVRERHLKKIKP